MTADQHAQQAVMQYPALQEVMQPLDAAFRAAMMQAITLIIQEAQHDERRECAKIALRETEGEANGGCAAVAERIATAILARDLDGHASAR